MNSRWKPVSTPVVAKTRRSAAGQRIARLAQSHTRLDEEPDELRLIHRDLLRMRARPVRAGRVAEESAVAGIVKMTRDGVERSAHDALERLMAAGAPFPKQQGDGLHLGQLRRSAEASMLGIRPPAEERDHGVNEPSRARG